MRRPLRWQLLLPITVLSIAAVAVNAVTAAVWASRRAERAATARLQQIELVLAETSFPSSRPILDKLKQLTGAEFAILDGTTASVMDSTLSEVASQELAAALTAGDSSTQVLNGERYLQSSIGLDRQPGRRRLLILWPERELTEERWQAVLPAVLTGGLTIVALVPLLLGVTRRLARRLEAVERKVSAVAEGNYEPIRDELGIDDEVHHLIDVVNGLSARLKELESRIEQSERARLLGQFAGGLAHQLRNAITGARLAVQLHGRRCLGPPNDDSLQVALNQLALTEQQIRGVLSLGRKTAPSRINCDPVALTVDVLSLVRPAAVHAGVKLGGLATDLIEPILLDRDAVQAAVLNLVLNAIEAAGADGQVSVTLTGSSDSVTWAVSDSGPGPSTEIGERLFDPFVTTKPDGVGLGLALARQVAEDHGGRLTWSRNNRRTEFRLTLPRSE